MSNCIDLPLTGLEKPLMLPGGADAIRAVLFVLALRTQGPPIQSPSGP